MPQSSDIYVQKSSDIYVQKSCDLNKNTLSVKKVQDRLIRSSIVNRYVLATKNFDIS